MLDSTFLMRIGNNAAPFIPFAFFRADAVRQPKECPAGAALLLYVRSEVNPRRELRAPVGHRHSRARPHHGRISGRRGSDDGLSRPNPHPATSGRRFECVPFRQVPACDKPGWPERHKADSGRSVPRPRCALQRCAPTAMQRSVRTRWTSAPSSCPDAYQTR
jgi:hypothetical protein